MQKILDLSNSEVHYLGGSIPVKISQFPDGQQSITITPDSVSDGDKVLIKSRLNSFRDLELIICANQSLREMGIKKVSLFVPYFLGARSDRKFSEGSCNYLKTVICPIINSQKFKKVITVDPHSDVLEACLDNFRKISNHSLVQFVFDRLADDKISPEDIVLISPDAGAFKKIFDVAQAFGVKKVIVAEKVRDLQTGEILYTNVPGLDNEPGRKNFLIVDDICDGGRTFVEIAEAIHKAREKAIYADRIYLTVTHGIFSKGYEELKKYFNQIFCTNSVKNIGEVYSDGINTHSTRVVQMNIFEKY